MDVRRVSAPPGRVQACGWLREPGVVQLALCGRGALRPGARRGRTSLQEANAVHAAGSAELGVVSLR